MEGIRVNKISVKADKYDTTISLYKTNQLVGYLYADDVGVDPISKYNISLKAYQTYIRDLVINLLDNGGIPGYYYEPKQESAGVKYDVQSFLQKTTEYVKSVIGDNYNFILNQDFDMERENYKNGGINNATAKFTLILNDENIRMKLVGQIRSGQWCRPRTIIYKDQELSFNITNINKIVRSN